MIDTEKLRRALGRLGELPLERAEPDPREREAFIVLDKGGSSYVFESDNGHIIDALLECLNTLPELLDTIDAAKEALDYSLLDLPEDAIAESFDRVLKANMAAWKALTGL